MTTTLYARSILVFSTWVLVYFKVLSSYALAFLCTLDKTM